MLWHLKDYNDDDDDNDNDDNYDDDGDDDVDDYQQPANALTSDDGNDDYVGDFDDLDNATHDSILWSSPAGELISFNVNVGWLRRKPGNK